MRNLIKFVMSLTVLTLLVGVSILHAQDDVLIIHIGSDDVPTIDPNRASDSSSILIVEHTFVPLTRLNEQTGELEPGLAKRWETEDGLTYTFYLLEDVPWVRFNLETGEVEQVLDDNGNPRYVTAQDVAYGITRMIDRETEADYAYVAADWIVGGYEFHYWDEEPDSDVLGIEVIDDYTIAITFRYNTVFTPMIFGQWYLSALPSWSIELNGDLWTEIGNYHTFGPYTVSEWVHDDHLTLMKNPFWPGTDYTPQASIETIRMLIWEDDVAYDEFLAGNIHVVSPPRDQLLAIKADPVLSEQLTVEPDMATYYYGFNVDSVSISVEIQKSHLGLRIWAITASNPARE